MSQLALWPPHEFATRVIHIKHSTGDDVYIGRPSMFGNPLVLGKDGNRAEVIAKYRLWLVQKVAADPVFKAELLKLRGKRLSCYCAPLPCHGHVLAEWLEDPKRFIP